MDGHRHIVSYGGINWEFKVDEGLIEVRAEEHITGYTGPGYRIFLCRKLLGYLLVGKVGIYIYRYLVSGLRDGVAGLVFDFWSM